MISLFQRATYILTATYYSSFFNNSQTFESCLEQSSSLYCHFIENMTGVVKPIAGAFIVYQIGKGFFEYYNREQIVRQWSTSGKELQLVKKGLQVLSRVYDKGKENLLDEYNYGNFKHRFTDRDRFIENVSRAEPILLPHRPPSFERPLYVWNDYYDIVLLRIGNLFMLRVFDSQKEELGHARFQPKKLRYPELVCSETRKPLGSFKHKSDFEVIEACDKIEIDYVGTSGPKSDFQTLFSGTTYPTGFQYSVRFAPKWTPSKIDSRFFISHNYWGVTMIRYNGPYGQHASLLFEGMEEGKYVMHSAELADKKKIYFTQVTRKNTVENKKYNSNPKLKKHPSEMRWLARSCVFKRKREDIYRLFRRIKYESSKNNAKYSAAGKTSVFGGEHNCFTWARERLKLLDIYIGAVPADVVACMPSSVLWKELWFEKTLYPNAAWKRQNYSKEEEI